MYTSSLLKCSVNISNTDNVPRYKTVKTGYKNILHIDRNLSVPNGMENTNAAADPWKW